MADYVDLAIVRTIESPMTLRAKNLLCMAPPWSLDKDDEVVLPDGCTGVVAAVGTVAKDGAEYDMLSAFCGTDKPIRLKGMKTYREFKYPGDASPAEETEAS